MYRTLHCVALRTVRYDDRHSILSAWSAEEGRISLSITCGAGREAQRRRALLMPLGLVECVVDMRPGREVHTARDMRPLLVASSIAGNPVKSAIALFIADVLDHTLRQQPADERLWQFIADGVHVLEKASRPASVANFHLWFLTHLTHMLGIEPDLGSWSRGYGFDLPGGIFRPSRPVTTSSDDWIDASGASMARTLLHLPPEHLSLLRLDRINRNAALDAILRYYSLHLAPLESLRSLPVMRQSII